MAWGLSLVLLTMLIVAVCANSKRFNNRIVCRIDDTDGALIEIPHIGKGCRMAIRADKDKADSPNKTF